MTVLNNEDRRKYCVLDRYNSTFVLERRENITVRKSASSLRGNLINDPTLHAADISAKRVGAIPKISPVSVDVSASNRLNSMRMNREIRPRRKVNIDVARSRTVDYATFHSNRFSTACLRSLLISCIRDAQLNPNSYFQLYI